MIIGNLIYVIYATIIILSCLNYNHIRLYLIFDCSVMVVVHHNIFELIKNN